MVVVHLLGILFLCYLESDLMVQAFRYFIRIVPAALFSAFCFSGFYEWTTYGDSIDVVKMRAAWQPGDEPIGSASYLAIPWLLFGALAWHWLFMMFKKLFGR